MLHNVIGAELLIALIAATKQIRHVTGISYIMLLYFFQNQKQNYALLSFQAH